MNIILMSGAAVNAGDFLIVKRSMELLRHCFYQCEIKVINRLHSCDDMVDELNARDAIVWAGGPLFQPNIYPQSLPFVTDLDKITIPQFTIGLGWKGENLSDKSVYDYKFSDKTYGFVTKMSESNAKISCRDFFTLRMLKNNGIDNCSMTGCPAWYDLKRIDKLTVNKKIEEVKKICISDPWRYSSYYQVIELLKLLRRRFSKAKLCFIYHRGNTQEVCGTEQFNEILKLEDRLKENNVESFDISGSEEGFHIYDDCDLHIGWRVHAHIYNMSIRNLSILIEEDARGGGFNEILGMQSIKAYENNLKDKNQYLVRAIDDGIDRLIHTNYFEIEKGFYIMKEYFKKMEDHIESLKQIL